MLIPVALRAQTSASTMTAGAQPVAIGNGLQAPLRFAGEGVPTNQVNISMGTSTFYNDNVLLNNAERVADEGVAFNSNLSFMRQTQNVTFKFNYLPSFFLYKNTTSYDRLNHSGSLTLNGRLSPRWALGIFDTASYQNGIFQPLEGQQISSGLSSPTAPNQTIYAYSARTLTNLSGLDLTFQKSHRTSISFTGSYSLQQYGSQQIAGETLYNGRSATGGFAYQYRVTEHTAFGVDLLHEDATYRGGASLGGLQRFQTESALVAFESHFAQSITVSFFGGPQYVTTFGEATGVSTTRSLQGAGGASVTKEVRRTALDLSVQRRITDSGGLFGQVEYTSASFGVRRRLAGHWEADLLGSATRIDTEEAQLGTGRAQGLQGEFTLSRAIGRDSTLRISYQNGHQVASGTLPITERYDLDLVTVEIDFKLKSIPIGH